MKVSSMGRPAAGRSSALKLSLATSVLWGRGWCSAVVQLWVSDLQCCSPGLWWLVEVAVWSRSYIVFACQDVFFSPFCIVSRQAEQNF